MRERDRQDELDRARRIGLRIDELTRDYASACEASSEIEHFLARFPGEPTSGVSGASAGSDAKPAATTRPAFVRA